MTSEKKSSKLYPLERSIPGVGAGHKMMDQDYVLSRSWLMQMNSSAMERKKKSRVWDFGQAMLH